MRLLDQTFQRHCQVISCQVTKRETFSNVHIANKLIQAYSKGGNLQQARYLFDKMPDKNIFSWNTMIYGYIRNGNLSEAHVLFKNAPIKDTVTYNSMITGYMTQGLEHYALELFIEMHKNGIKIDRFTVTSMLKLVGKVRIFAYGHQIHCYMVKTSHHLDGFEISSLIDMYSKCGFFSDAFQVFNTTDRCDSVCKNAMVAACFREGHADMAMEMFWKIPAKNDVISWNTLISGYTQNGHSDVALQLFVQMGKHGIKPNEHTFASILSACSNLRCLKHGKEVHGQVLKIRFCSNPFICSGIIDVYCKCNCFHYAERLYQSTEEENVYSTSSMIVGYSNRGNMVEARRLFDLLSEKNSVVWTTLFSGYIKLQDCKAIFKLFQEFQRKEMSIPDILILVSVLSACSFQASLNLGKQIHAYVLRIGIETEQKLTCAMIDMYAKCGHIKYSENIFSRVSDRDRVMYNAMIAGLAHHGQERKAIYLFNEMLQRNINPDSVTFIALLSACRHAGLVEFGNKLFDSMFRDYGITPEIDHYSCMVDLLGRANHLDKVLSLIKDMPMEPDAIIWGTFLNACRLNGNIDLAKEAEENLLRLEANNGARYVQLANAFASAGEWREMERIRRTMRSREVKKLAGCSWIYIEDNVHTFTSGDTFHAKSNAIYAMLYCLNIDNNDRSDRV